MARLKSARFEERLTLVEHLDELRSRIIVCIAALLVAIGLCFWQDELLLGIANRPLPSDVVPITLSPTEPFMTTLTVVASAGLLLALPVILYQAFAFILPALAPAERRAVTPFFVAIPFLFIAGVLFAYYVIMPVAVGFLLSFNETEFAVEVRARDYYGFLTTSLLLIGLLFEVPVVILSLARLGIVTPEMLAERRRHAVLVIAIVAAIANGSPDPVSMVMMMAVLYLLYEASIVLARIFGRPGKADEETEIDSRSQPGADLRRT